MALVSEVLDHIGRIYSPLNLAIMKSQKLTFFQNTAKDNQRSCATLICSGIYMFRYIYMFPYKRNLKRETKLHTDETRLHADETQLHAVRYGYTRVST